MSAIEGLGTRRRQGRRWFFGSAVLDENTWTLSVDGAPVTIETKPLELLHELLLRAGQVATKGELLDAVWPGVSVVEASLPTAISKLRKTLGDNDSNAPIIVTVTRIGYRLAVPVSFERRAPAAELLHDAERKQPDIETVPNIGYRLAEPEISDDTNSTAWKLNHVQKLVPTAPRWRWAAASGLVAIGIAAVLATTQALTQPAPPPPVTHDEAIEALRALDMPRIRELLSRGWKPQDALTPNGDAAINIALEVCEWNPSHDQKKLMLLVRMLLDHGAWVVDRNRFGDTPYSIAKAPRYCGPDHPATQLLHAMCYSGPVPPRDKCLASYEVAGKIK